MLIVLDWVIARYKPIWVRSLGDQGDGVFKFGCGPIEGPSFCTEFLIFEKYKIFHKSLIWINLWPLMMRTLFHRYFEAFFLPPETKEEYHRIHSNWCLPPQNAAELEQLREHNRTESKNKCPVSVQMLDYQKHVHFLYQNRLKAFSCITRGNDFRNFFSLNYYYPSIHFYLSPTVNYHHIRNLQKFIFF